MVKKRNEQWSRRWLWRRLMAVNKQIKEEQSKENPDQEQIEKWKKMATHFRRRRTILKKRNPNFWLKPRVILTEKD